MIEFTSGDNWSWTFVCWELSNHRFNFSNFDWSSHVFSFFIVVLGDCTFLRICLFLQGCPFYQYIFAYSSLLWSLYFCGVSCNFIFISNFIDLGTLSFLLKSLAKGLSILFIFSKNQLLVSLIISIVSISYISALIIMISFLLLILGFVCSSFLRCFRCKVRLLIWDFYYFLW